MNKLFYLGGLALAVSAAQTGHTLEVTVEDPGNPQGVACSLESIQVDADGNMKIIFSQNCIGTNRDTTNGGSSNGGSSNGGSSNGGSSNGGSSNGGSSNGGSSNGGSTNGGTTAKGECREVGNVKCLGASTALTSGGTVALYQEIAPKQIRVYSFVYKDLGKQHFDLILDTRAETSVAIEFTVNQNPGEMDVGVNNNPFCVRQKGGIGLTDLPDYRSFACLLEEGETYYLNVHNTESKAGKYTVGR